MTDRPLMITGRLIAAARALAGISQSDLADASGISVSTLAHLEASGSVPLQSQVDAAAVRRAVESFGVMFIAENDRMGAGVRLKFLRRDVRQIDRLENEGGIVGYDDVP
jgi:transcriptional regulator with XRE-family HTH domain